MPSCPVADSPFTSGTTSGMPSTSRKADDLSTHRAPPATAAGTRSLLAAVPTEKKHRASSPEPSASRVASSTMSSRSPYGTDDPAERSDANARTSSKPRSASNSRTTGPTAPVAPTTPIRGSVMRANRLGAVELERLVECLYRLLDLPACHEEPDLDRRGRNELGHDAALLARRDCLRGIPGMAPHACSDYAHLPKVVAARPLHAEPVEHCIRLAAIGRGEDDLVPGLDDGVDVNACVRERLEEPRRAHALDAIDRLLPAVGDA